MTEAHERIRAALAALQPLSAHEATSPPALREIYTPPGHESALDPDRTLVEGGRGMGKSFWAGALTDPSARGLLAAVYPRIGLERCDVCLGFAAGDTARGGPPSKEVLDDLLARHPAELVWRTVIWKSARGAAALEASETWRQAIARCAADPEQLQLELRQADQRLAEQGQRVLIVFDALDRMGSTWAENRERAQALLRVALAMRLYRSIRIKIFIRTDQAADEELFAFPDASKLTGGKVNLTWDRRDLYGLVFARLAGDDGAGAAFQELVHRITAIRIPEASPVALPTRMKDDEATQARVFVELAGPYMGRDKRRGKTYSWLHSHLSDAFSRVSPRSFLVALHRAAWHRPAPDDRALDAPGLESGVRYASESRVEQLAEEYPWIRAALTPLADLRVPCPDGEFHLRWAEAGVTAEIRSAVERRTYLGPIELSGSLAGDPGVLLESLRRIGVVERRPDGRINMPDIFRVAAKLLKRGGIPPRG